MKKISHPSPNYGPRPPGTPLDLIIVHYTDMLSAQEALDRLCDVDSQVSAHFLIDKEGTLYELVDPIYRAWHAGVGEWQGESDINSRSIGIELDNRGHTFGIEPFPPIQMDTLLGLLAELTKTYAIPPHRIVGHSDIAPLRKQDPGELFPWGYLASQGFGMWPLQLSLPMTMSIGEMQKALADIGYACPQTGIWDETTQNVCLAFQRHFTPTELTGYPSELTWQMLRGLLGLNTIVR